MGQLTFICYWYLRGVYFSLTTCCVCDPIMVLHKTYDFIHRQFFCFQYCYRLEFCSKILINPISMIAIRKRIKCEECLIMINSNTCGIIELIQNGRMFPFWIANHEKWNFCPQYYRIDYWRISQGLASRSTRFNSFPSSTPHILAVPVS